MSNNVWQTSLSIALIFYVTTWKTGNLDYIPIANTAAMITAAAIITDFLVFMIKTIKETP